MGITSIRFFRRFIGLSLSPGREIRTPDPLRPRQVRYQTALYPENLRAPSRGGIGRDGRAVWSFFIARLEKNCRYTSSQGACYHWYGVRYGHGISARRTKPACCPVCCFPTGSSVNLIYTESSRRDQAENTIRIAATRSSIVTRLGCRSRSCASS